MARRIPLDSCHSKKRVPLELAKPTSFGYAKTSDSLTTRTRSYHEISKSGSHLRGTGPALFSVKNFCRAQNFRRTSSHLRRVRTEQIFRSTKIQSFKSHSFQRSVDSSVLDDCNRYPGCISSCTCKRLSSQISCPLFQRSSVFLQVSAVRSSSSSICFHRNNETPFEGFAYRRCTSYSFLRRSYSMGSISRSDGAVHQESCQQTSFTRFSNQLFQVTTRSNSMLDLARGPVGLESRHMSSSQSIYTRFSTSSQIPCERRFLHEKKIRILCRESDICNTTIRQSKVAVSQNLETSVVPITRQRQNREDPCLPDTSYLTMEEPELPDDSGPSSLPTSRTDNLDGRVSDGLGSVFLKESNMVRNLESGYDGTTHKSSRIENSSSCSPELSNDQFISSDCHRQRCNKSCHNKPWLKKQQVARTGRNSLCTCRRKKSLSHGNTHIRSPKRSCRCAIKKRSDRNGMESVPKRVQPIRRSTRRTAGNRPIRYSPELQDSTIRNNFRASERFSGGCDGSRLEQVESNLPVSSSKLHEKSSAQTKKLRRGRSDNSSPTSERSMVSVFEQPLQITERSRISAPVDSPQENISHLQALRSLDRIQFLQRLYDLEYPETVGSQLIKSSRESSIRQANTAWNAFKVWLKPTVLEIKRSTILEFLVHLADRQHPCAPNTILSYRNSLRVPLNRAFGIDFSHGDFSALAKAQFLANPPRRHIVPQWSLEQALLVLEQKPALSSLTLKEIFLLTLFLTALASGNRISELAAIDRKAASFAPQLASVTLPVAAGFLFKNQSAGRTPPNIVIPELGGDHPVMCPVRAIKLYLAKTKSTKSSKLFLNPETGTPLNAGTLAFWLCKAINYLLPDAICKSHDVRKLSHSLAWTRGVPMDDIIKRGFWSSQNVFIRRYLVKSAHGTTSCVAAGHRL